MCGLARAGVIPSRTQSSVAVSGDNTHWFLVNASPDLRTQIEAFAPLQPRGEPIRSSPIDGVLLTNADLDHTLGLFALREGHALRVHLSAPVRQSLIDDLHLDSLLRAFTVLHWCDASPEVTPLTLPNGASSGLLYRAIALDAKAPRFAKAPNQVDAGQAVAYVITDERSGKMLVCAPDVGTISDPLRKALIDADAILFDGTFSSDDELRELGASTLTARQMGHLPVCESLPQLASRKLSARVIYIHINNTNPMLDPNSAAAAAVRRAGFEVGWDGLEFDL
jgi:pyrroloquinoline quinone biosynthesis protein B